MAASPHTELIPSILSQFLVLPNDKNCKTMLQYFQYSDDFQQSISQRVSFDRANGKVHCTMIGRGRARGFYPLEPFLGALQAKMQICLVYELDFTGEQALVTYSLITLGIIRNARRWPLTNISLFGTLLWERSSRKICNDCRALFTPSPLSRDQNVIRAPSPPPPSNMTP